MSLPRRGFFAALAALFAFPFASRRAQASPSFGNWLPAEPIPVDPSWLIWSDDHGKAHVFLPEKLTVVDLAEPWQEFVVVFHAKRAEDIPKRVYRNENGQQVLIASRDPSLVYSPTTLEPKT